MKRRYGSRLARVEEKRNIKKAYLYVALSIVAVGFLFFTGLPLLIKFAGFFTDLGKSDKPVDVTDITPPAPPQFDSLPEFTNQKSINLEGSSEDGAIITLSFNGSDSETVANSDGNFSFELVLRGGENSFSLKARDQAGNEGMETPVYNITFDNEEPKLEISSPKEGDTFYGSLQRQVNIKGYTDPTAEVYINDRFVAVSDDGTFSFTTTLNEGINEFNIRSADKAGNEASTTLNLNFVL